MSAELLHSVSRAALFENILVCAGPDYLGQVEIKGIIMEVGVGPARYSQIYCGLVVCISTGSSSIRHLHIQTVTAIESEY